MQSLTSRTIFFFAFQWKTPSVSSDGLSNVLAAVRESGWQATRPLYFHKFSQENFFHDFARSAVFEVLNSPVVFNFQKKLEQSFHVEVRNKAIDKTPADETTVFPLHATFASLDIYEAGVGVFSLTLDCPENAIQKEDLLAINDLGRRLYPQTLNVGGIAAAQNSGLLPVSIGFENDLEDFAAFVIDPATGQLPQHFLPKYLLHLLGSRFKVLPGNLKLDDILIENTFDDRMFVLSCLVDEAASAAVSVDNESGNPAYLEDSFWYKFIFVDGGSISIKNRAMQRELVNAATYPRWSEDGTVFGASRYSFVAVAKYGWIFGVMAGNYAQLVKLCLVQRAAVLRYREEATAISASIEAEGDPSKIMEKIRLLHGDFIRFSNRLNFHEVTAYEQGIELYDLIRRQMRVQEQVDALKEELAELHDYSAQLTESVRNRTLDWLSFLGAAFLIPSFLMTYFGFFENIKNAKSLLFWLAALGVVVPALVFFGGWLRRGGSQRWVGFTLLIIYLIAGLLIPLLLEWFPQ